MLQSNSQPSQALLSLNQDLRELLSPTYGMQEYQEQIGTQHLNYEFKKTQALSFDNQENSSLMGSNEYASTAEVTSNDLSRSRDGTYEPIVGVLTMPVSESKQESFQGKQEYILKVNDQFHTFSQDSRTVAIRYNLEEDQLYQLLDQINGVHFTGGALDLIDPETGKMHPYYVTAKRIVQYSMRKKDEFGVEFPVIGICQGFETLSLIGSQDVPDLLDYIDIYDQNRNNVLRQDRDTLRLTSEMYNALSDQTIDKLVSGNISYHAHTYSISMETYNKNQNLKEFFQVLSTDSWYNPSESKKIEFITSMEAYNYPIYAFMFHPEYQQLDFLSQNGFDLSVDKEGCLQFCEEIALFFHDKMLMNDHVYDASRSKYELEFLKDFQALPYPIIDDYMVYAICIE